VWSIATVLTGAASNFATLIGTRLAMGAGEASTFPAGIRTIREWVPVSERGFATAIFNSGAYAGPAFGALLLGWTTGLVGWRGSFYIAGIIGFIWLAAWLIWYRKPEDVTWLSDEERAMILAERDADKKAIAARSGAAGLGELLRSKTMWGLALTQGCAVYTQYLFRPGCPTTCRPHAICRS
jgi:ACS family glucarate transporter-like MFS transporter